MRIFRLSYLFLLLAVSMLSATAQYEKGGNDNNKTVGTSVPESGLTFYPYERVLLRAEALKMYAKSNGYNTRYAFIINMGMKSNTKRFFIVNLAAMCIESTGLVAHGKGDEARYSGIRQYSNKEGSNCTSLGKYTVGKSYNGFFGLAYQLEGLEKTNNNSISRKIVLHSMHCIPEIPDDKPICVSEGCPAVADQYLAEVVRIVDRAKKPVLLLIYDSTVPPVTSFTNTAK